MTPKEKAKELLIKFLYYVESFSFEQQNENAKQCVLIAVDEILKEFNSDELYSSGENNINDFRTYWQEVKEEINKL